MTQSGCVLLIDPAFLDSDRNPANGVSCGIGSIGSVRELPTAATLHQRGKVVLNLVIRSARDGWQIANTQRAGHRPIELSLQQLVVGGRATK
jgi:hypothetical protein